MLEAVRSPRLLSLRVSFSGFTATMLLVTFVLSGFNPGFLSNADWLCPARTETPESNVEEFAQDVVTVPNSHRRHARQHYPQVFSRVSIHLAPALGDPSVNESSRAVGIALENIRMQC